MIIALRISILADNHAPKIGDGFWSEAGVNAGVTDFHSSNLVFFLVKVILPVHFV